LTEEAEKRYIIAINSIPSPFPSPQRLPVGRQGEREWVRGLKCLKKILKVKHVRI
jgi:hypothetical protein